MKRFIADLDGVYHVMGGGCCANCAACKRCGSRQHMQGCYDGMIVACEQCESRWFEEREDGEIDPDDFAVDALVLDE